MFSESIDMDDSGDMGDVDYRTQHAQRCKQLGLKDPVYATSLKDCVHGQLMAMRNQVGHERYQQLMCSLPRDVLENLKDYFDFGIEVPPSVEG